MEECELCGARVRVVHSIEVDGVALGACPRCALGMHALEAPGGLGRQRRTAAAPHASQRGSEAEDELVENYGEEIRRARTALGLPLKVVAERLNEKASYLSRIEAQQTAPNAELISRLERFLGIRLLRRAAQREHAAQPSRQGDRHASIGEFA